MFRQAHYGERVPIPTSALVCASKGQLNRILQAFVQRKRLFKYHDRLHGVVVNIQVDCFHPTQPCTHSSHVWPMPADCHYVHVPCTYHATVLALKPGDRLACTVKTMDERGLHCSTPAADVELLVYKETTSGNPPTTTRPIPDSLWRPGAFATLVFEGVSAIDGPFGSIAPEFVEEQTFVEAPGLMLSDAREHLFELDAMLAAKQGGESLGSGRPPKPRAPRKNKKVSP